MLTKKNIAAAISGLMLLGALSSGVTAAAPAAASAATNKMEAPAVKKAKWETVDEALNWMKKNKKSEQLLALYDPADGLVLFYEGVYKLKTYKEFTRKQAQYNGPAIPEPDALPDGYRFKFGTVHSQHPQLFSKEYKQLQKQLKKEAAEKGEIYYFKELNWDASNRSALTYEKGKNYISIIAEYNEELHEGVTQLPEKGVSREKLEIGGTEAVYVTYDGRKNGADRLEWNSGDGTVKFRITSFGSGSVSKEEMMAIAETIISAQVKNNC
ncbi:DUF4367 domain-containing protein [Paenibacillus dendritiformis]|uniref:DUF4367 domain-containing protein n=1 Tax=Paenibacillus dendritiformis TaxID=130049 RepID=UPI0005954133|nr:DUF4367 domain-containing protein [Paenibacillus dendritiformis]